MPFFARVLIGFIHRWSREGRTERGVIGEEEEQEEDEVLKGTECQEEMGQ